MLHSVNALTGFSIVATDGDLGSVDAVYFDDAQWMVRYLVVDTGRWLSERKVLISPFAIQTMDWTEKTVRLNLTRQQIENSPGIDADQTVSRQYEAEFHDYFDYPYYWTGPFVWGATAFPESPAANPMQDPDVRHEAELRHKTVDNADPHLRNCKEVIGYAIRASDAAIGHAEDFLFDDEDWSIRLMVVDPRNWLPGKHVMISPKRIDHIEWAEQTVAVNMTRDEVRHSPEYDDRNPPLPQMWHDAYRGSSGRSDLR